METVWDWITVAMFAALVIVFLQRSVGERPANDRVVNYLPPALGCAAANYFGNAGDPIIAAMLIAAVLAYTWYVIRPGRGDMIR